MQYLTQDINPLKEPEDREEKEIEEVDKLSQKINDVIKESKASLSVVSAALEEVFVYNLKVSPVKQRSDVDVFLGMKKETLRQLGRDGWMHRRRCDCGALQPLY